MSSWPLISDFSRMLQNPGVAFRDAELRNCRVELDNLGQPKARSGNFATVYKGYRADGGEFAIRVFNRQANLRREAYQAKSEYLKTCSVSSLVGFNFEERGIRASDGKMYPLLTMEWVPGVSLFEWIRDRCREGYQEALSIASEAWLHLVRELEEHNIVHGDLQHGNVLVSMEGHIKLVDYDCMAVPDLMGQPNFEIGMEPYQHPQRNASTPMVAGLDNFSAIVIYVALRALAAAPHLWIIYVDNSGYDKILFRKEDFANPNASPLYHELLNSPDEQVRDLAYYLFQLNGYQLQDLPNIDEVMLWCCSLDQLVAERDWDRAVQLVQRMGAGEQIADHLKPQVERAQRCVKLRAELEEAYLAGSEWRLQELYDAELMSDYPAAQDICEKGAQADDVIRAIEQLNTARRFKRWNVFKEIWDKNAELLNKRPSAMPYRNDIRRVRALDTVRKLVADQTAQDRAVIDAWKHLVSLRGREMGEDLEPQVQQRVDRQNTLTMLRKRLEQAIAEPTTESDKKMMVVWHRSGFEDWPGAADIRPSYHAAARRLECMYHLRAIVDEETTIDGEAEIDKLAREIPDSYHPNLPKRVELARKRVKAYHALLKSLKSPRSDLVIAAAWHKFARANGQKLVDDRVRMRVRLAKRRAQLLKNILAIPPDLPLDQLDNRLLDVWDETLLTACHDAREWEPRYQQAVARRDILKAMRDAIEQTDSDTIARLRDEASLRNYPLPDDIRQGIDDVKQRMEKAQYNRRQNLIRSLSANDRTTFYELFDIEMVSEICEALPHHQAPIGKFTEHEILPLDRCGLTAGEAATLEINEEGRIRVAWHWPEPRISNRCCLMVCPETPKSHQSPVDIESVYSFTINRPEWDAAGQSHEFSLQPEWEGHHVVVWAVLDLGFQIYYTEPLDLGRLAPEKKSRKWRLFG